VTLSKICS